jgi:membrane protease YdiL (CAAX protease family)
MTLRLLCALKGKSLRGCHELMDEANERFKGLQMIETQDREATAWTKVPIVFRAIISGVLIALIAANIWPLFLIKLGAPWAALCETLFLGAYIWWASGGGPPQRTKAARTNVFRRKRLSGREWLFGILAAVFFAVTVHSAIVLLFRFVPFPLESFRRGYNFSFIPTLPLRWLAVVFSAASAGICEETGFRGYMQRPIEQRYGNIVAILTSSFFFTVIHLTKGWAMIGMVPIVFGAGLLLGLLAWSSNSLIPCMIGHTIMDIGLFAYWWTGVAGDFTMRPIAETGVDRAFLITCVVFAFSLGIVLFSISKLRSKTPALAPRR